MRLNLSDGAAVAICGVVVLLAQAADTTSPITGSWRLNNWTSGPDRVQFELTRITLTSHWSQSNEVGIEELHGLKRDQLHSVHSQVRFEIDRDPGVLLCEGSVVAGVGGGTFQFSPSGAFAAEMRRMGYGDVGEDTLFSMLMHDVNLVFVRAIQKTGMRDLSTGSFIKLRVYGITPESVAEIRSAGYDYSTDDLVRLKVHGVRPDFLRDLKRYGYGNLSSDEIVKLRIHGVDSDYVRGLGSQPLLSPDEIVKLKIHGVDTDFVRDLRAAHYEFSPDDMVKLKNQGVNAQFAGDVKRAGYDLSADQLVRLHMHGVAPDFLAQLRSSGYQDLSIEEIVRMWQFGVRGDYIARVSAAFGGGARRLTPDQIIKLKTHGVD